MVKARHHGKRSKTRDKYSKKMREKGMPTVNSMIRVFNEGDSVHIAINPSVHSAMPYRRFIGKTGIVTRKQGECYVVEIKDIRSKKEIIIHPAHLKKQTFGKQPFPKTLEKKQATTATPITAKPAAA